LVFCSLTEEYFANSSSEKADENELVLILVFIRSKTFSVTLVTLLPESLELIFYNFLLDH